MSTKKPQDDNNKIIVDDFSDASPSPKFIEIDDEIVKVTILKDLMENIREFADVECETGGTFEEKIKYMKENISERFDDLYLNKDWFDITIEEIKKDDNDGIYKCTIKMIFKKDFINNVLKDVDDKTIDGMFAGIKINDFTLRNIKQNKGSLSEDISVNIVVFDE